MKKILLAVVLLAVMSTMALAEGLNCTPPCPTCPPVQVTCECSQVELPGLWEVKILGEEKCGAITIIGSGFLLEREGKADYFLINRLKRAKQVESCE